MSDTIPKVSIVLPTYNGSKYIRASIDSCLNQTYGNTELIVVDDGSTDDTPEIIRSYDDKRIRLIRHEKNKNLPNALNTGFADATGDYLTWTSDDNYYAYDAIEKMVKFLVNNKIDFVYTDIYYFNEYDRNMEIFKKTGLLELDKYNGVGPCFLYSRKIQELIGIYDPDTKLAEDFDYWIRVSKFFTICHIPEPLYYYRLHNTSLTSQFQKQYDIDIMAILVRLKNDVITIEDAKRMIITIIVKKKLQYSMYKSINLKLISNDDICNLIVSIKFSKLIKKLLYNMKNNRQNIQNTKELLKRLS